MQAVSLRCAKPSDAGRVFEFLKRLGDAEGIPEVFRINEECFRSKLIGQFLAEAVFANADGRDVGVALCLPGYFAFGMKDAMCLACVFVEPEFRRRGIFKQYLSWAVRRARIYGRTRVVWACLVSNKAALAAYHAIDGVTDRGESMEEAVGSQGKCAMFAMRIFEYRA